jgi:hypothetical protein
MKDVITSTFPSHQLLMSVGRHSAEDEEEMKQTYVKPVSSASKTGSHPKLGGPRAGMILPSVRPSKRIGSVLGPVLYAKVQIAHAARVGKPSSMRLRPKLSQSVHSGSIPFATQHRSVRGPSHTSERHAKSCEIKHGVFILIDIFLIRVFWGGFLCQVRCSNFPDGPDGTKLVCEGIGVCRHIRTLVTELAQEKFNIGAQAVHSCET